MSAAATRKPPAAELSPLDIAILEALEEHGRTDVPKATATKATLNDYLDQFRDDELELLIQLAEERIRRGIQ